MTSLGRVSSSEPVGELAAVIRLNNGNIHQCSPVQAAQETSDGALALVAVDAHTPLVRGPFNGHVQITPGGRFRRVRQALNGHA